MNKKILRLAIPNIISNLSVPILSSVDTAVVGHLDDISHLGAIAIGGMIFNFIYWGFGFLRMGTTGLTAQAFGERNNNKILLIFFRALSVAAISSIFLILSQKLISALSFYLVNANYEVELFAGNYFDIRIYAAPATLSLYAFHGWFLGMQNAKYPLILAVFVNILNIIFNLLLIYQFGMESDGVALGTVLAQYSGLLLAIFLYFKKYSSLEFTLNFRDIFELAALKKFFSVNFDIFLRTLALIFTFSYFTAKSAEFGEDILAVNTILLQFWHILSYGVDGFAFAAESLVGKYTGEKDKSKLRTAIKAIFYWGIGMGVVLSFTYWIFGENMLWFFTDKQYLVGLAMTYFGWTIAAPLVNSFCFIWDGIFIGATATKAMRNTMILSLFLVFLPVFLLTKDHLNNHSLWLAMILFMMARGLSLSLSARKSIFAKV
ncbi:MAG: MATE family efflux transporter [Melioribacteraceae bacterium]|nr:MATE family efflux transporter [Melioribacteraceae bacterium]MCF8265118.1 MATE family efflux transporter [Melioribacteraceae bacterium]MCF8413591.1 MATE family efflux transporter [Melioribacteraceae bacterium]